MIDKINIKGEVLEKPGVYKISNSKGQTYVGQSKNLKERLKQYKTTINGGQRKLKESFNELGRKNHTFEVIEYCKISDLDCSERYWQEYYNVIEKGLNLQLNRCKGLPTVVSNSTRLKMSKSATNKKVSEETKMKLSDMRKGDKNSFFNRTHSEEARLKMSQKRKGENNIRSKIVLDLQTGVFYFGVGEASEAFCMNYNTLYFKLSGRNKNNTALIFV